MHPTLDHLFILQSIIDSSLGNNNKVYCATVDFRKACPFEGGYGPLDM